VIEVIVRLKGKRGYEVGRAEAEDIESATLAARTLRADDKRENPYQGRKYEGFFMVDGECVMNREVV
jgi:hypothetical protein